MSDLVTVVYLVPVRKFCLKRYVPVTLPACNNNVRRADLGKMAAFPFMCKSIPGVSDKLFGRYEDVSAYRQEIAPGWFVKRSGG